MRVPLYLRALGNNQITTPHGMVPLSGREAAFLAYLCYKRGARTTRSEVADLFWPAANRRNSRHSLSQLIYAIRCHAREDLVFASDELITSTDLLQADFIDLLQHAANREGFKALELYTGRFLGRDESYSERLRDWRDNIEEMVAQRVAHALQEQSCEAGSADLPVVISVAQEIIALHPHLVEAQIGLIEATVRTDDLSQAERLYAEFRSDEVVGTTALPPLESFLARRASPPHAAGIGFVGRETELALLERRWTDVQAGAGNVAIILGEPGIGKTRLADHFFRKVAIRGGGTWIVRCCAATQRLPYSIVSELVRENVSGPSMKTDSAALEYLRVPYGSVPPQSDEYRYQLTEALTSIVISRSADQPLAILVDDAQWADDYTALLLSFWSYRLRSHKVMLVLTVRTEEADPPPEWITLDLGKVSEIRLGRIGIGAAAQIVESFESNYGMKLDQDLRDAILWRSGGRPFLLLEALTSVVTDSDSGQRTPQAVLSESAESVLRRRFRALPHEATSALASLAVWGHEIQTEVLGSLAGLDKEALASGLDVLHSRGIVCWTNGTVMFPHDLMREAAYRSIRPAARALYHYKSAEELLRVGGATGLIAQHFANAGDSSTAATYAAQAANEAFASHLYADYEYYCRMCIEFGPEEGRRQAAEKLGRYLVQVGRTAEIEQIRHLLTSDDGGQSILIMICRFEQELSSGKAEAVELLRHAKEIASIANELGDVSAVPIIATLLDIALDTGSYEFGMEVARMLISEDWGHPADEARLIVRSIISVWKGMTEGHTLALEQTERCLDIVSGVTSPTTEALCLTCYGTLLLLAGEVPASRKHFDRAATIAITAGDHRRQWAIANNNAIAMLESRDFAGAKQSLSGVLTAPNVHCRIRGYGNLAITHYEEGDMTNASGAAQAVLSMNESYKSPAVGSVANAILGLIALDANRDLTAREHLNRIERCDGTDVRLNTGSYTHKLKARILSRCDRRQEAIQVLDEAITSVQKRDRLCALRLSLEKATLLSSMDRDKGFALARKVEEAARSLGATLICDRATILRAALQDL